MCELTLKGDVEDVGLQNLFWPSYSTLSFAPHCLIEGYVLADILKVD